MSHIEQQQRKDMLMMVDYGSEPSKNTKSQSCAAHMGVSHKHGSWAAAL